MTEQQEYFMALRTALKEKGYKVFDGALPPENTPYPFIYLAGSWHNPTDIKRGTLGMITQVVQVWGTYKMRGTISAICEDVLDTAMSIETTDHYAYKVRLNETEQQLLNDDTTNTPLMQGYTSLRVAYSRR